MLYIVQVKQVQHRTDWVTVSKMVSMSRTLPPKTVNLRTSKESELHNVVLVYFVSPVISDDDSETDLDSQTRSESESSSISE